MRPNGFTLIEVLAVLFLTALVFGVALNFYVDLSNQSHHASEATREVRRATSLLDRLARDFERALLVQTPDETDPLDHPWFFVAQTQHAEKGADRVKFVTRRPADRRAGVVSDIALVSYLLHPREHEGDYEILRWSSPSLPERQDVEFPQPEDPDALVLADGVSRFELRFLDQEGEWLEEWDSTQLLDNSGELPQAVEITVALSYEDPDTGELESSAPYMRRVVLPIRPLDLATLLDPVAYAEAAGESPEDAPCELTVSDCIDLSKFDAGSVQAAKQALSPAERQTIEQLQSGGNLGGLCWDDWRDAYGDHPSVRPQCR